jgi:tetratricopeptide (TPR) repeat protein
MSTVRPDLRESAGRRLAGRDAALAAVDAALDDAVEGSGTTMLVSGEPGIGKSALLAEAARRAAARGVRVLRGSCWQGAPSYWMWTQVLRGLGGDLGAATVLLDADGGADREGSRFALFDAVARALTAAAPAMVVLDDLQWADDPALRLLEFLRGPLTGTAVLVLGAYRDGEAGPALQALAGTAPGIPLRGLDAAGVATVMATIAGPAPDLAVAEETRRRCGGNPFFVRELTRLMVAAGGGSGGPPPIPDGVRDMLRMRLSRLSASCGELLALAAVVGSQIDLELLAAVGPDDAAVVVNLLDEAERARVLLPDPAGRSFAHDLFREAALALVPPDRIAQLHLVVGHALVELAAGGSDPDAVGGAARIAAHFVAAGPDGIVEALRWSERAAVAATERLGHEDAARHYAVALRLASDAGHRCALLVEIAAAHARSGRSVEARESYLRAADVARSRDDGEGVARAALGMAALGVRAGADDPIGTALLEEARARLAGSAGSTLRSRVLAALARAHRHAGGGEIDEHATALAEEAVALARAAGDDLALAQALLAHHDVLWRPGTADQRLPVLAEMATAADRGGAPDLVAEAELLRATALIEQGDPAGVAALAHHIELADGLGHARGRWGALSRRATLAEILGRVDEAAAFAEEALALGRTMDLPDADGCFGTLRGSLAAIGGPPLALGPGLPRNDPLWAVNPLLQAWTQVHEGDLAAAAATLRPFSLTAIAPQYSLELRTIAAVVLAAVGTAEEREHIHARLVPFSGLHVIVSGSAAYHGAVDHHLGALEAALGRTDAAAAHLTAAIAQQERLGAPAWAQLSRAALDRLRPAGDSFRRADGSWLVGFDGTVAHLADAKGLHDIATLLAVPARPVHVFALLGRAVPATGADPVLDRTAVVRFRERLAHLDRELDEADDAGDAPRCARITQERAALLAELQAASGLGGRSRRLGDETERARKTVSARVRDALRRVERVHPALAAHLRSSLQLGTTCIYLPDPPRRWRL